MTPDGRPQFTYCGAPAPTAADRYPRLARCARAASIGRIVAVHLGRVVGRGMLNRVLRPSESERSLLGWELTEMLDALGATFVKVGQVLSCRPDLLPEEVIVQLRRLQQRVSPFPESQFEQALEQGLGMPIATVFASIDPTPIASASMANVYRARLHDGRSVAVKVRRPGIGRQIHDDLAILETLARQLQRTPMLRVVPLTAVAEEIAVGIRRQVNFAEEAASNRRFRANFASYEGVSIPGLVEEYCTRSILTMEFIDGLRRLDTLSPGDPQAERAALIGLHVLYKMVFMDGFVHVDMHPGNIFIGPLDEFAILDFGLVAALSDNDRRSFSEFFVAIATNDGRTCARIVLDTAQQLSPGFDAASFDDAMVGLVSRYAGLNAEEFEVARFAVDLFDVQRRHGVRGSTNFTLVIVAFVVFEGIVKQIAPALDFQAEARAFLASSGSRSMPAAVVT